MKSAWLVGLFCLIIALQVMSGVEAAKGSKKKGQKRPAKPTKKPAKPTKKPANVTPAINLGDSATLPYFVKIETSSHICGGVLISTKHILTTATCIRSAGAKDYQLYFFYYADSAQNALPKLNESSLNWIEHPNYHLFEGTDRYNLAIIRMSQDIESFKGNSGVFPVPKILYGSNLVSEDAPIKIFGMAMSDEVDIACVSDRLLQSTLTVKSLEYCRTFPKYTSMDERSFICAASVTDAQGACLYDEGGPAASIEGSSTLFGIIDRQPQLCPIDAGTPTRIIRFTTEVACWIQEQTQRDFGIFCDPPGLSCDDKVVTSMTSTSTTSTSTTPHSATASTQD